MSQSSVDRLRKKHLIDCNICDHHKQTLFCEWFRWLLWVLQNIHTMYWSPFWMFATCNWMRQNRACELAVEQPIEWLEYIFEFSTGINTNRTSKWLYVDHWMRWSPVRQNSKIQISTDRSRKEASMIESIPLCYPIWMPVQTKEIQF